MGFVDVEKICRCIYVRPYTRIYCFLSPKNSEVMRAWDYYLISSIKSNKVLENFAFPKSHKTKIFCHEEDPKIG